MGFKFLDRAKQAVTTGGTGDLVLGGALQMYQTFYQAGAVAGDTFPYCIIDGNNWEIGVGTLTGVGLNGSLQRAVTKTSAQNATPLNISTKANVSATYRGEDLGVATRLDAMVDVAVNEATMVDGFVLGWSVASAKWVGLAGGGGGSSALSTLSDVTITSVTSGQFLKWNGTKWVNSGLGLATVATTGSYSDLSGKPSLATVATTGAYSDLSGLPTLHSTLVGLSDVNITTGAGVNGYSIIWDNGTSKFILSNISGGGGGSGTVTTVQNAGTNVDTAATAINFVGATSVAVSSHVVTVTLPSGGGGPGGTMTPPTAAALAAVTNLGSSVLTTRSSGVLVPNLHIQPLSSSNSTLYCALKAAPVGSFSLVVKVRVNAYNISGGWYGAGPVIHNSSGTLSVYCMRLVGSWATYLTKWTGGFTSVSFSGGQTFEDEDMFLHIDYDGTNYMFGGSRNGKDAVFFFSEPVATFIGAITHVGIGWSGAYNSASGPEFDYEHFFAGTRGSSGL